VLNELREFRQQYDQVWHSVMIDFEQQRQQHRRELFTVTEQLGILADELVYQKRISIIQSIFVLICFGLVLFSRGAAGTYLELSRVHGLLSRSHSFRSASPSYDTPSASPSPAVHRTPYGKTMVHRHARLPSDESQADDDVVSVTEPIIAYSAPTPPVSDRASTRSEDGGDDEKLSPRYQHSEISCSSASNSMMLTPDSAPASRPRSSPPSLGRQDTDDVVVRTSNPI
jgi:hypothetical protein